MGKALLVYDCQVCIRIKIKSENNKKSGNTLYRLNIQKWNAAIKNWTFTFDLIRPGFPSIGHHEIYHNIPL